MNNDKFFMCMHQYELAIQHLGNEVARHYKSILKIKQPIRVKQRNIVMKHKQQNLTRWLKYFKECLYISKSQN